MDDESWDGAPPAMGRAVEQMRAADEAARRLAQSVGDGLSRAMVGAVSGSETLGGALRGLAADLARAGLRRAFAPIANAAAAGLGDAAAAAVGATSGALPAAVRAFARGGVVDRPTFFGAGVMGEAGPEAILPLARGADGRLGVRGGGVTVNMTISSPDAESFRRSSGQVVGALARAVARGQRRL